jgi:hypothetical protein
MEKLHGTRNGTVAFYILLSSKVAIINFLQLKIKEGYYVIGKR